jgi:hypothetical protein
MSHQNHCLSFLTTYICSGLLLLWNKTLCSQQSKLGSALCQFRERHEIVLICDKARPCGEVHGLLIE